MNHRSTCTSAQAVWVCMALALVVQAVVGSPAQRSPPAPSTHHLTKRSFHHLQCKGVYDKSIFARLDRICEDCYNLFREVDLHTLCRNNCFTTNYFEGCVEVLQLHDQKKQIQEWIKQTHGAAPGV